MKFVACIMLANGREAMVARAVASFHAQEYPLEFKQLFIWNTGNRGDFTNYEDESDEVTVAYSPTHGSIGTLRNRANRAAVALCPDTVDLFAHWDSDDLSHPRRLTEQVALLEHTGADLVGYRECVFYDQRRGQFSGAWIYRGRNPSWPIGSSFLYTREAFERFPFPDKSIGEDTHWLLNHPKLKTHAIPSTWQASGLPMEPRMICSIHSENTSSKIVPSAVEWTREPRLDEYCRTKMAISR